jgi:hypothetical protein
LKSTVRGNGIAFSIDFNEDRKKQLTLHEQIALNKAKRLGIELKPSLNELLVKEKEIP